MVTHFDHVTVLALVIVAILGMLGKYSLTDAVERNDTLTQLGESNSSYVDEEDTYDDGEDVHVNLSTTYVPHGVNENSTSVWKFNDSMNATSVNETEDSLYGNGSLAGFATSAPVNKCVACAMREDDRKYRIAVIKNQILEKLHFHSPPNMTGRTLPKAPKISQLLERSGIQGDSPDNYGYHDKYVFDDRLYGHTERIFTIAKTPPPDRNLNESYVAYFNLPDETRDSYIKKAVLWYYVRPSRQQKTAVELHIRTFKPQEGNPPRKIYLRYKKLFPKRARNWHQLDIRKTVQDWVDRPSLNYGLQMTAFDHSMRNLIVTPPTSEDDAGYEPMIELKTVKRNYKRVRRSAIRCSANSTEPRCCRYPLRVNFVDFGWDWVIAPRDYAADYCSGECRYVMQDENHHSYLQQQAGSTGPCCTPTMMSPLSMLYFDHDHNILFTNLQEMKVERCGCA
ncbi:growth/differentiation factor 8-like [Haliotis rufescens]|uniref:growth/differentiation factor 8-like n=1 Tax=Haliotis rufescens TaxID=6454 RepID=UPI001EAFAB62|nr:growth/differentiation factor 8-like [Haliotis rufescens]